jgi:Immunoglobulin I-set domain/Immunoglobulin domain
MNRNQNSVSATETPFAWLQRFVTKTLLRFVAVFSLLFPAHTHAQALLVASASTGTIYRVPPNGNVSTYATGFNGTTAMVLDGNVNLFVATGGGIFKIEPGDVVIKLSSAGGAGLAIDDRDNFFYTTFNYDTIYYSGGGSAQIGTDPITALALDGNDNLYFTDLRTNTVGEIMPPFGAISTFASGFNFGNPSGATPYISNSLLAFDSNGNLYVANTGNGTVSKVTPGGQVSTYASGFNMPNALTFDDSDDLFVSNYGNNTISEVTPGGNVSTFVSGITQPSALAFFVGPPFITVQPSSETVVNGENASFSVTAFGNGNLSYQWSLNGNAIPDATSATYAIPTVATLDAGNYSVVVTNTLGNITSATVTLTVVFSPNITTQPVSKTVVAGHNASFTVSVSGTGNLSYQWQYNGNTIPGATNATLTFPVIGTFNGGNYDVVVSNPYGNVTSAPATLTVLVLPTITTQPKALTVKNGAKASFTVKAAGTTPLSYQWQLNGKNLKNGGVISGATTATLSLSKTSATNTGSYRVIVTNAAGSKTSAAVKLTLK